MPRKPIDNNWVGVSKRYYEYHPLLGWRIIPNTKTTRINAKGTNKIFYQINSNGIRGPEYSYDKPRDEYRILFLGDSFSEAYLVTFEDMFSEVMARKLNASQKNKSFKSINSGTSGWSTDQELLFFQHEGKKYKSDITVLMFFQNDIYYNNQPKDWSMYYKPLFKIEDGVLVLTNVPVPKPDNIVNYDQIASEKKTIFKNIRRWFDKNSYLYRLIKERIKNTYFLHKLVIRLNAVDETDNRNDRLTREYHVWTIKYNEAVHDSWTITEALIKKLKEETNSIGSKLVIFFVPHEANIDPDEWTKIKTIYGYSDENWDINQVRVALGGICKRNNIDFLDPTELLKAKTIELKKTNKSLFHPIDRHWSADGNKIIGDILADYISFTYLKNN